MNLRYRAIFSWPILIISYLFLQIVSDLITTSIFGPLSYLSQITATDSQWHNHIMIAIAESMAMVFIANNSKVSGYQLLFVLASFYWGTKIFMMMIEAVVYLNIWLTLPLMSMDDVIHTTINGAINTVLISSVVIWICNKWQPTESTLIPLQLSHQLSHHLSITAVIKISLAYVPIYLAAGMFLAMPLGGEAFKQTYGNLVVPLWMPLFQLARGLLWALLLWVLFITTKDKVTRPVMAVTLAVFGSVQLLYPNPFMLEQLRAAHLIEVSVSMAIFGWFAAAIYSKDVKQQIKITT